MRNISRLAQVLRVADLADLLGDQIPAGIYTRPQHDALDQLRLALVDYQPADEEPPDSADVHRRVSSAWSRRAASSQDRTEMAPYLPDLLRDAERVARAASTPTERRDALATLTRAYLLVQLYLAYQGVPELICVVSDRASAAAWESDDPEAISSAAWLRAILSMDLGEIDAALRIAEDARRRLGRDDSTPRQRSLTWLSAARSYGRDGAAAEALGAWDRAVELDTSDPPLSLYSSSTESVALLLDTDLGRARSALNRAQKLDIPTMPTIAKRASALVAAARAHALAEEWAGALHLLRSALAESTEQVKYSLHAQGIVMDLIEKGGPLLERDSRQLASDLGIAA